MCISAGASMAFSAISTGAQVLGSMGQASNAEAQGRANASAAAYEGYLDKELRLNDAAGVKKQTLTEANKVRDQAVMVRGVQLAQQASSGIVLGEGSAQTMIDQTNELATADTLAVLYTGTAKALGLKQSGDMSATSGVNRANAIMGKAEADASAARFKAAGSFLGGAGSFYDKGVQTGYFKPAGKA